MGQFLSGIAIAVAVLSPVLANGFYALNSISVCEKNLPRTQQCRITAEPVPVDQTASGEWVDVPVVGDGG